MRLTDEHGNTVESRPVHPKVVVDTINETVGKMSTQILDNGDGSQWILLETIMGEDIKLEIYNNMSMEESSLFELYLNIDSIEDIKKPAYQASKSKFVAESLEDIDRMYNS